MSQVQKYRGIRDDTRRQEERRRGDARAEDKRGRDKRLKEMGRIRDEMRWTQIRNGKETRDRTK